MRVYDLLNTSVHMFAAYRFRGAHDDDMSGYWVKRYTIPDELLHAKLFGWEIINNRLLMAVDDVLLEKVLYTLDGGDGRNHSRRKGGLENEA